MCCRQTGNHHGSAKHQTVKSRLTVTGKVGSSRHGYRHRQLPRVAVPRSLINYLFRFSFTRNFTILFTSVSGSGLSFGNCTAPLDHLYGPNCFLKTAIPEDVG